MNQKTSKEPLMTTSKHAQQRAESKPVAPFQLIYRCKDFLILNKPANLLSVPGRTPEKQDSLQSRTARVYRTISVVHRLDCATSGIMIMPLNKNSERQLSIQFQNRAVKKTYIAKANGICRQEQGTIDLPLIGDWPNRPKQIVEKNHGKPALTHWQVLAIENDCTRFELHPITGRSHQLRVHLSELGYPILGDRLYAPDDARGHSERLLLHAQSIEFQHPVSLKPVSFYCECPF